VVTATCIARDSAIPLYSPPRTGTTITMHFPKLTPLQSRFAACLGTSIVLLLIYFSLNPSHFAYAAELDSILNQDHNHHRIALGHKLGLAGDLDWGDDTYDHDIEGSRDTADYQAAFAGISRSIIGRAPLDTVALKNNLPNTLNIDAGETQYYVLEKDQLSAGQGTKGSLLPTNVIGPGATVKSKRSLEDDEEGELKERDEEAVVLDKRQNSRTVYLSVNTCLQPALNENRTGTPGQLTIYYSLRENKPTADNNDGSFKLDQGYGATKIPDVQDDLFISITAPDLPNNTFTGPWSYQIAASTDDYYHYYNSSTAFMWTIDTDSQSALLATYNLTDQNGSDPAVIAQRQAWMSLNTPPFDIYVFNSSSSKIDGIEKSYCGLSKLNMDFMRINTSMSERGVGSNPKQQFYMESLVPGNTYFSVLAYGGGNTSGSGSGAVVGGGGQVWKSMQFSTKSGLSCLPFLGHDIG
jgi:calcium channel MID1